MPDQYTRINDEQLIGQLGGFGENGTPDIADSTGNGNNNPLEEFANHTGGTQTSADWLLEQAGSEIPETTKDDVVQVNPIQDLDLPLVLLSEDVEDKWSDLNLSNRHIPQKVTIPKKTGNTMLTIPNEEIANDLTEIRQLGDSIRTGDTFTVSSGRVYGIHNNSIHPISGPGTVNITSAEYNILVTARKKGFDNAQISLDKMSEKGILTQEQYERTQSLLDLMNNNGG